jgi:hypothetical protein
LLFGNKKFKINSDWIVQLLKTTNFLIILGNNFKISIHNNTIILY